MAIAAAGFVYSGSGAMAQRGAKPTTAKIVRLDPRFDRIVPQSAVLEKIAEGFTWVEGPAWNRKEGCLLFSDIPANAIMRWNPDGSTSVFQKPSGYTGTEPYKGPEPGSNGLAFDRQGRLTICEHGDRRVTRLEANGRKTVLADRYEGKRFNSPNDLAIRSNGDIYFTDPPYGLPGTFNDPAREIGFNGVYRIDSRGAVTLLTRELNAPNGIAFSPDEKTLYVSNSDPRRPVWMAYEVKRGGTLGAGRVFYDATPWLKEARGVPDGMKVDRSGNLFASGPGGMHVLAPDGKHLGYFTFGVSAANCAFGGDGSTLYIAVSTAVYRIALNTKGY
jgi:gluconolactonase